jgi:hypothetical protein
MGDLKQFERMVEAARGERAPRIDVASRVLATVESYKYRPAASLWADSPLLAFAGFSLAAAALVAMLALPCWESVQDPLVAFCKPLSAIFE